MPTHSLGEQELALLRYIWKLAPLTAGQVSAGFGEEYGLARSTIETMMERLRKKGYLDRVRHSGVYQYSTTVAQKELMTWLVQQFVENTLAGSLTPFVHYFTQQNLLSLEEIRDLERLVEKLQLPENNGG